MGSSSLTGTADGMGRGKRELGERAVRGKNNQEKRRIVSVQGLSSPGQQRVRAGGDPALLARLPWLLRVRDLLGQALEKKNRAKPIYCSLVCHREKGQGLPVLTCHSTCPWPEKGLEQHRGHKHRMLELDKHQLLHLEWNKTARRHWGV